MRRLFFQFCFFLILAVSVTPQELKVVLIDSFDRIPCSVLRAQVDSFLFELVQNPDTVGFVVVNGDDFTDAVNRRGLVENHIKARRFDLTRVRFVRKSGIPRFGVELWKVPPSADLPFDFNSEWSYMVSTSAKPSIVYTEAFNESECLFPSGARILGNFLSANTMSRGNIVIECNGRRCFREKQKQIFEEMKGNQVSARLRFFYIPVKSEFLFKTEYWP